MQENRALTPSFVLALKRDGFSVTVVDKCLRGLAVERVAQLDAVVLDVTSPTDFGPTICRRLRSLGIRVPVIVLTASDDSELELQGGVDAYIARTVADSDLALRIYALARRRSEPA